MIRIILERLGQAVLVLLAVSAVSFAMFRFVGDPVATLSRENATVQEKAELRVALGLDRPILVQYGAFLSRTLRGELGISYRNQQLQPRQQHQHHQQQQHQQAQQYNKRTTNLRCTYDDDDGVRPTHDERTMNVRR